ncbi:NAD(P)-binding domain-containing protein [Pseudalkalibacillus decolorationis]|uniref:NAD(P)-binding domain-containing protein n=1 Tax=Pseudalkalibacillus decolorationis TaxID=163879 RepID=UPI002147A84C|nr:NAD(P)-binding domain-containing protein [Pseudalkalibacillus decolorationis]
MEQIRIGLIGIGRLGTALMKHWCDQRVPVGIYHPDASKAKNFIISYPNGYLIKKEEIHEMHAFVLALPANQIVPFLSECMAQKVPIQNTCFINMATALNTQDVCAQFTDLNIVGLKFLGHSTDLLEHGNGLFITEQPIREEIRNYIQVLGEVKQDREEVVGKVNELATYLAINAAIDLEDEFENNNFPLEYKKRAMTSLFPEVIRSYSKGNLGHFGKEIEKELKNKGTTNQN